MGYTMKDPCRDPRKRGRKGRLSKSLTQVAVSTIETVILATRIVTLTLYDLCFWAVLNKAHESLEPNVNSMQMFCSM